MVSIFFFILNLFSKNTFENSPRNILEYQSARQNFKQTSFVATHCVAFVITISFRFSLGRGVKKAKLYSTF